MLHVFGLITLFFTVITFSYRAGKTGKQEIHILYNAVTIKHENVLLKKKSMRRVTVERQTNTILIIQPCNSPTNQHIALIDNPTSV